MTGYDEAHLERVAIGQFRRRTGPDGRVLSESPLDGKSYCSRDLREVGKQADGFPNRVSIAAYTGDPAYLTLHGDRDPREWAAKLQDSRWRL